MKLATACLFFLPATTAFSVVAPVSRQSTTSLGATAAPPMSYEEDLALTIKIILDHQERSATASKDQFISQMSEAEEVEAPSEPVDLSIPYDAAARLAYEASDKTMEYDAFKTKYESDAVADVVAKKPVDVSIPYDAPARLAYDATDKKMDYAAFKTKFEADAVSDVIAKQPVDVSIPYDAPARLAFEASDKTMDFTAFKSKFEADAVADVIAKQPAEEEPKIAETPSADLSIPYDAAARLAYEGSDKSMKYSEFKSKFEAGAVADVIAKQNK